jgi:hypothetical protein
VKTWLSQVLFYMCSYAHGDGEKDIYIGLITLENILTNLFFTTSFAISNKEPIVLAIN